MNTGIAVGLRFLAFVIDLGICLGVFFLSLRLAGLVIDHSHESISLLMFFSGIPLALASPILYLGLTTGFWGRTVGKFVCKLRVVNDGGGRLGLWRGLGRESFKLLVVYTHFGAIIAAIQILMGRKGFHDSLCGTDVEFIGGLTATQKAWRKHHGGY